MCQSPSVPNVPNASAVASTQQNQYNIPSAIGQQAASNYNSYTPYGSYTYQQSGVNPATGMPTYSVGQSLSSGEQAIFNGLQGGQAQAAAGSQGLVASGNYGGAPNILGTANSSTNQMLGNELQFLTPYFNNQISQLDTQLRNQGIMPGSPAYNQQMMAVQQNQGGTVNQNIANMQPAAFNEALQNYMLPLQTAQGLQQYATGASNYNPQQLTGAQNQLQPANYVSAVGTMDQANMAAYQAQMQQQSAMLSGVMGAVGTLGGGYLSGLGKASVAAGGSGSS